MTKPLFTITFTPEQAVDFIKQQIKDNYSSLDNFDVVIQQKTIPDSSGIFGEISTKLEVETKENPWLTPDEDGWFTHDPNWKAESAPSYIDQNKILSIMFYDGRIKPEFCPAYANWSQENNCNDIAKWKYVD